MAARSWRLPRPARRPGPGRCAYGGGAGPWPLVTRKIAILGATGSIGKSALDLIERSPDRFEVAAVTAATNVEALADIARRTGAKLAVISDQDRLGELRNLLDGTRCTAAAGADALVEAAASEADLVIAAIVGCAGL